MNSPFAKLVFALCMTALMLHANAAELKCLTLKSGDALEIGRGSSMAQGSCFEIEGVTESISFISSSKTPVGAYILRVLEKDKNKASVGEWRSDGVGGLAFSLAKRGQGLVLELVFVNGIEGLSGGRIFFVEIDGRGVVLIELE